MRNAATALLVVFATACGAPIGPIAGGELQGTEMPWPRDWTFTDDIENVLLETNPDDPYSVTVWGVSSANAFYVAGASRDSRWVQNMLHNAQVTLSVDGNLYVGRASRVIDAQELRRVGDAFTAKYDIDTSETSSFFEDGGIIFRLNDR